MELNTNKVSFINSMQVSTRAVATRISSGLTSGAKLVHNFVTEKLKDPNVLKRIVWSTLFMGGFFAGIAAGCVLLATTKFIAAGVSVLAATGIVFLATCHYLDAKEKRLQNKEVQPLLVS